MPVHAFIAPVRTRPKPAILAVLHRFNKELAHFIRRRLRIPMFAQHHLPQFLLVPTRHIILFLLLILTLTLPRVRIQIPLLALPPHLQIMTEFALLPLLAAPLFVELTEHGFWVDAEGHFLDLDGFEEFGGFPLRGFGGGFFALTGGFFGGFAFFFRGFGIGGLGLDVFDLFLGGASLFLER